MIASEGPEMARQLLEAAKGLSCCFLLRATAWTDLPNCTSVVNRSRWIMLTLKDL